MAIYDKQIKDRIKSDDSSFDEALNKLAESVTGRRFSSSYINNKESFNDSLNEIFAYYKIENPNDKFESDKFNEDFDIYIRSKGLSKRAVALKGKWWKDSLGAYLVRLKDSDEVIALIPSKLYGYVYYDKKAKKYKRVNKKITALFSEDAYEFIRLFKNEKLTVKDLFLFTFKLINYRDIFIVVLITLVGVLLGFLLPKLNNIIYSYVIYDDNVALLVSIFATIILINVSSIFLGLFKSILLNKIKFEVSYYLNSASYARAMSFPSEFYRTYNSGLILSMISNVSTLVIRIFDIVLSTGITSLFSLSYIGQMYLYAPGLVLPGFIVIFVTLLISILNIYFQTQYTSKHLKEGANEVALTYSLILGINKIKMVGAEKRAFSKWANAYSKTAKTQYSPPFIIKYSSILNSIASSVGTIVIYFFTISTNVSLADYFSFTTCYGIVSGVFASFVSMGSSVASFKPTYMMVKPLLQNVPENVNHREIVKKINGNIELSHVSFRYKDATKDVLSDFSIKIKSGDYLAIVGKTGCGKTTLMKLLLGFETPYKGAIYFDGKDVAKLDLNSLRRKIGSVMQDGKLFPGDIYSNITITCPEATKEEAFKAAELASFKEDIENMPMGMNTLISDDGGGLSGGQRQRLLIARALVFNPKILIFDEATSALDNITQKKISDALDNLKCTRIVIAHRLSTIKNCSRIIVIDDGKIIEDGNYDELISKKGYFYDLVKQQQLDK